MKTNCKAQFGQTLIETMVTLLFMAFGVLALIRFQNYLAYDNSLTRETADATQLALSELETLSDYQVINILSGYNAYQSIASGTASATTTTTTYTISWTVTPFTNPTYKTVVVTVTWNDRKGGSQSLSLVSKIASIDPAYSAAIL